MIRLALAWVIHHPAVTLILIGARTPEHIENALAAREVAMDGDLWAQMHRWPSELHESHNDVAPSDTPP